MSRTKALALIKRNIQKYGFHFYTVTSELVPRYSYTIGLRDSLGAELVLAGCITYLADDLAEILNAVGQRARKAKSLPPTLRVRGLGSFTFRVVHQSWSKLLLLGAFDYYNSKEIEAYQIVPDHSHWTIDIPDMTVEWSRTAEPIWQWLREDWRYDLPQQSSATTNLDALRGAKITEAVRWEEDEWEMFAGPGPDVPRTDARVVPLATLLAFDPSLRAVADLPVGAGIWRDGDSDEWHPWKKSSSE